MRMMPITASVDTIPQGKENKSNIINESIEKSPFKIEYDKKIEKIENKQGEIDGSKSKETKVNNIENGKSLDKNNNQNIDETSINKNIKNTKDLKSIIKSKNKAESLDKITKHEKDNISQIKSDDSNGDVISHKIKKNIKDIKIDNTSKNKILENDNKNKKSDIKPKKSDDENINQDLASQLNIPSELNKNTNLNKKENSDEEVTKLGIDKVLKKTGTTDPLIGQNIINNKKNNIENKSNSDKKEKTDNEKLKVIDFRKDKKSLVVENVKQNREEEIKTEKSNDIQTNEVVKNETNNDEIILGLKDVTVEGDGGKQQAPVLKEIASQIKQQLKDYGNNEIVKQSKFILKDNNIGEIKLILKPESLGQVKINLNLNENSLAGQIVVENNSVKEIFQENMANLTKALEDQGYDSTKLELSMDDKSESRDEKKENKQYFSERLKRIDESGNVVRYGLASAGIDLTA